MLFLGKSWLEHFLPLLLPSDISCVSVVSFSYDPSRGLAKKRRNNLKNYLHDLVPSVLGLWDSRESFAALKEKKKTIFMLRDPPKKKP